MDKKQTWEAPTIITLDTKNDTLAGGGLFFDGGSNANPTGGGS